MDRHGSLCLWFFGYFPYASFLGFGRVPSGFCIRRHLYSGHGVVLAKSITPVFSILALSKTHLELFFQNLLALVFGPLRGVA